MRLDRILRKLVRPFLAGSLPQTKGSLNVEGLKEPVQIHRDEWGMPHIFAEGMQDLFFGMGFAVAQDRFWQMEGLRRVFRGELAAVFGCRPLHRGDLPLLLKEKNLVGMDLFMRCLDLDGAAHRSLRLYSPETTNCLNAFTLGVNRFLREGKGLPLELRLPGVRYRPSEWTPTDILLLMKGFAFFMNHAWKALLAVERLAHGTPMNPARAEAFWPTPAAGGTLETCGTGSNAWVLSPHRTSLNSPILCNDPHLLTQCPSPLYPCHLSCRAFHATGLALPGIPGILAGHNERIAWGVTDAMGHCSDLFLETCHERDSLLVREGDDWVKIVRTPSLIEIKKDRTRAWNARKTKRGPILSDVVTMGLPGTFSLQWTGFEARRDLDGLLGLLSAKDFPSFREALGLLSAPTLNVAYADVEGNVAFQSTGLHPRRLPQARRGILDATKPTDQWQGFIPFEELPFLLNPNSGQIELANQKVKPAHSKTSLPGFYSPPHRANTIREKLASQDQWNVFSCQRLQLDVSSAHSQKVIESFFEPFSQRHRNLPPESSRLLQGILAWNGSCDVESWGCLAYHAFFRIFRIAVLGRSYGDRESALYLELLSSPGEPIVSLLCEIPNAVLDEETRDDLAAWSLREAHKWISIELHGNEKKWQWGALHKTRHQHAFTEIPLVGRLFDIGPVPSPGTGDTVNRADYLHREPFVQRVGASARLILTPGDWDKSTYICSTGISGHVGSAHYDDMSNLWLEGRQIPLSFHSTTEGDVLHLQPAN